MISPQCPSLFPFLQIAFDVYRADYRKSPIKPPRDLLFKPIWGGGGLIETGGLFNLESTMVSVLHKEV